MMSCTEDSGFQQISDTSISIKILSSSALYEGVFLEIKDIQVQTKPDEQDPSSWVSLSSPNIGVHDFSNMSNGSELIFVEDLNIPARHIYRLKLILGDENAMIVDNILVAIETPDPVNKESINIVDKSLDMNKAYEFTMFFELDASIQLNGHNATLNPRMNTELRLFQ